MMILFFFLPDPSSVGYYLSLLATLQNNQTKRIYSVLKFI
jgi:hypothetical protein